MIRAIIVDDELHCRKTLQLLLKEYCPDVHVVQQCSGGHQGLEGIGKLKPDLVFLDVEMPGMSGFEMLEQLSDINFAVIFTTGYDQYAIKAFRVYALDYLLKPIESKDLISAIHKLQQQKQQPTAEQFQMLWIGLDGKKSYCPESPFPHPMALN
jgi:two-component system, LytTR family, response regulator